MNRKLTPLGLVLIATLPWLVAAELPPAASTASAIRAVLEADTQLQGVPFGDVIFGATGRRVLPLQVTNAADRDLVARLGDALDQVLLELNAPDHPAHTERRINEVSAHFEQAIRAALNAQSSFACDYSRNAAGRVQRAGYPDLRLEDRATGRVVYLDPKLFERGNRTSSLRTLYYEPNPGTNKVLEDAHHLLIGIEHTGKTDGQWRFTGWHLVDLSRCRLRLKAEFQASNRDLYRPETVLESRSGDATR